MSYYRHHIFFCLNQREGGEACCAQHDAKAAFDHCKAKVKAAGLAGPGGVLTAVGRVTAMSGTYLLLVTLLLIARIPAVERAIGQDRLVKLHRQLGPAILGLISVHVVAVVLGYAAQVSAGPWHELIILATTFPGMMLAVAGLGLLFLAAFTS